MLIDRWGGIERSWTAAGAMTLLALRLRVFRVAVWEALGFRWCPVHGATLERRRWS